MQEQSLFDGQAVKQNLKNHSSWMRLFYMILFSIAYMVVELILTVIIVLQIFLRLFMGEPNERLRVFSADLSKYIYDILNFLTFNTETKPFPFSEWARGPQTDTQTASTSTQNNR